MSHQQDQATVSAAHRLIERAEADGAAFMLFDRADRVVFANRRNRDRFPFVDFDQSPTYDAFLVANLAHRNFVEPEVYQQPGLWLIVCRRFRRQISFGQFHKRYPDGSTYLVTHEILPGIGSCFSRVRIPSPPAGVGAVDDGTLRLPGTPPGWRLVETTAYATAVVLDDGLVLDRNAEMTRLLRWGDCLREAGGRLVAVAPRQQPLLVQACAAAAAGRSTMIRLGAGAGEPACLAVIGPWALPFDRERLVSVVVVDPRELPAVPTEALIALYGLTPAEARVAAAVGQGEELAAIAGRTGTRYQTVRAQLRSVFQKTGLNRQAELVGLCTRLAVVVPGLGQSGTGTGT